MYLYIDETECHEYFIVTGLMVNSKQEIETAYKRFKKKAESIRISANMKAILFSEFKSTLLDKHYQKAKKELLLQLNEFEYKVFYSCFEKKNIDFRQGVKEKTYIRLLSLIISSIKCNVNVCFDRFP